MSIVVSANGKRLVSSGTFHYEHQDNVDDEGLKITYDGLNVLIKIWNASSINSSGDSLRANVQGNNVTFFMNA